MKNNIGLALAALVAVLLAIALIATRQRDGERQKSDAATILDFSNQWTKATLKVDDLNQVNVLLHNDLATNRVVLADVSSQLAAASGTVTNLQNLLVTAQDQAASQGARLTDLQRQNQELTDRAAALAADAVELTNQIERLNGQIKETQAKLDHSLSNNGYLQKQLEQLIEARAELEHKFYTLATVQAQLQKLEDDVYTERRLRWIQAGTLTSLKGAPRLMQLRDGTGGSSPGEAAGLHMELGTDGSIRAVPTTNSPATNAPAP